MKYVSSGKTHHAGEIMLGLPRFELEFEATLNDALAALGMELAFTAATSVGMITSAPSFMMTVDRPFFFIIHDAESDAILFIGSVVELGG